MRFTPLAGFTLGREPLVMPVEGARAADLRDSFDEARGSTRRHEAIDILAPRGTAVVAAVDGSIEKLFTSEQGGLTVYEFDRDRDYCYYYAHLDRYAEDVREGKLVHRGDRLGYVGSTGDASAEAPHLHFAIFRLGPDKAVVDRDAGQPLSLPPRNPIESLPEIEDPASGSQLITHYSQRLQ